MDELQDFEGFRAWIALLHAHTRLVAVLERELTARTGLSLSGFEVLQTLADAPPSGARMQEVAAAVLLSKSGTTRVVAQLEEQGLVVREIPPENRRVTYARLTEAGREVLGKARPPLFALVHEHFGSRLEEGDAATLVRILGRVAPLPTTSRHRRHSAPS